MMIELSLYTFLCEILNIFLIIALVLIIIFGIKLAVKLNKVLDIYLKKNKE